MNVLRKDRASRSKPAAIREATPRSNEPLRLLRFRQLREIIPWSRTTCWRAVRERRFPAPVRLSKNTVAWRSDEVFEWLERRNHSEAGE
jgi:predicted DNA-binding transcriptional regulator AlpA